MANNVITVNVSNDVSTVSVSDTGLRGRPGLVCVSNDVSTVLVSDTGLRGRPGLVWRGEFSATVNYYVGNAVSFQESSYIVTAYSVASTTTPDVSANFSALAIGSGTYVLLIQLCMILKQ